MGIVNVTPDSFSDGGIHFDPAAAIAAGLRMIEEGADLVDVGGESTRPGAAEVALDQDLRRTIPVVKALAAEGVPVSIETSKAAVAEAALDAGAAVVTDVIALSDPAMGEICAAAGCYVCLMHMQGSPRTMQHSPTYEDVVREVREFLLAKAGAAEEQGIARERIWLDPGIGFGKTLQHNILLLKHLDSLTDTGYPVLVGVSRKSFIGRIGNPEAPLPAGERLEGTLAAQAYAQMKGAKIIRAHDVKQARRVIDMLAAIEGALSIETDH
jgi:dihydropteroate synthase